MWEMFNAIIDKAIDVLLVPFSLALISPSPNDPFAWLNFRSTSIRSTASARPRLRCAPSGSRLGRPRGFPDIRMPRAPQYARLALFR